MAVVEGGVSGGLAGVGVEPASPLHATIKGIPYGALGHYRTAVRINSTAAQAANSRILTIRNTHASNLIIPIRLKVLAVQTAVGTAQENSLDLFKCTGFTVDDTVNTVTPGKSALRTNMAAYPGSASVRHLTLAGAAAGMTGGTLTKDAQAIATFPYNVAAAVATTWQWGPVDMLERKQDESPLILVQNEGIELENRVLNVTSYGITWFIEFSYAEVTAY